MTCDSKFGRGRVKFIENPLTFSIFSFGIPHPFVFAKERALVLNC